MDRYTKVRDVMTQEIRGISEEASLLSAAEAMAQRGIDSLVVWPIERDRPYGIITSSDIVDAVSVGKPLRDTRVADLQSAPLVLVTPGVPVVDAAKMMARYGIRHLAVFNGKELVGIVANRDILKAIALPTEASGIRDLEAIP